MLTFSGMCRGQTRRDRFKFAEDEREIVNFFTVVFCICTLHMIREARLLHAVEGSMDASGVGARAGL